MGKGAERSFVGVGDLPIEALVRPDGAFYLAVFFGTVRDEAVDPDKVLKTSFAITKVYDRVVVALDGTEGAPEGDAAELEGATEAPNRADDTLNGMVIWLSESA